MKNHSRGGHMRKAPRSFEPTIVDGRSILPAIRGLKTTKGRIEVSGNTKNRHGGFKD
jgi:hypothetical protein